jgi:hypothetical protein
MNVPPDDRVFFTDRDLGVRFGDILAGAGLTVERHRDHFRHDYPDEDWLREVGARGWVALTHNSRIRYTPNELVSVVENEWHCSLLSATRLSQISRATSSERFRESCPS